MLPEVRCIGTIFSRDNLAEKKPIKRAKSKSRSGWAAVHKNCEWDPQFTLTQPLDALEYYSLHTGSSFGQSSCLIARSKHVGLGRARERKSLQRSLYNLRSAPSSAWLIFQIIKVEWTNQKKKTGNDPLAQCSFNREAVTSCPLRKIHKNFIVQLKCYGAHFISRNKAAKKCFKIKYFWKCKGD